MAYKDLNEFIKVLEAEGELIRIKAFVNPHLEISEITDRISKTDKGGKALLFENTGTSFPVLMNAFGSYKRMCLALQVDHLDNIGKELEDILQSIMSPKDNIFEKLMMLPKLKKFANWMPKVKRGRGLCQEVVMDKPDLSQIPILTCWPKDGGPFITLPVIHTKDPTTNARNVGMYRMQVFEKDMTGMHWHMHKVSAKHFAEYKKLGKKMPVAVTIGGDPVYTYSATAPLPENVDEYILAGFLRKKKVELVKCITIPDIEVPADADFVIEGFVDPNEDFIWEGPFGDHTGFYSLADWYPKFHVTAITYKKNAIYPSTIVGIPPQEDTWLGKATERIFLTPIKMTMVPEIKDMNMPVEGVFHNLVITKIEKTFPGQANKVMNALWGAGQMMFNKILIITDLNTELEDYKTLAIEGFKHFSPAEDAHFSQGPMDVLDHSCSNKGFGGKLCIDFTKKTQEEQSNRYHYTPIERINTLKDKLESLKEINQIGVNLLENNIPCLILSVTKNRMYHLKELHHALSLLDEMEMVKMVLYIDHFINPDDISVALWTLSNHLDPKRDHYLYERKSTKYPSKLYACLGLDGTIKTKKYDGFERPWPNIIVSNKETIDAVDKKWKKLNLGKLIPSPSLKFVDNVLGDHAEVIIE